MRRHRKPATRRKSCHDGQKEKMTKADAIGKAKRLRKTDGALISAYRCKHTCYLPDGAKAWHVGHVGRR